MKKKKYEEASIEIIDIAVKDVITTSADPDNDNTGSDEGLGW